jgi:hypothetical protein
MDKLRDREMFILEYKTDASPEDRSTVFDEDKNFFNYKQSYFWFNNTVKNFPEFGYDDISPLVNDSENFCLHVWYK